MSVEDLLDDAAPGDDTPPADDGANPPAGDPPKDGDAPLDKDGDTPPSDVVTKDLLSDDEDDGENKGETSYEFEVPDGLKDVSFDAEALDAFKATAKELGLSQEQFQKLAEYDMQNAQDANQKATEAWQERVRGWQADVLADKDIGGDNFAETKVNAKAAVEQFADPDLVALLKSPSEDNPTGLAVGNHPAFMRFLNRIGKALADPTFHGGEEVPADEGSLQRMYPSMFKDA